MSNERLVDYLSGKPEPKILIFASVKGVVNGVGYLDAKQPGFWKKVKFPGSLNQHSF